MRRRKRRSCMYLLQASSGSWSVLPTFSLHGYLTEVLFL